MLAEVLTNARQCHQCPLLIVALTMVVHASPQTSIAEEHPHLRQVMELQGEWTCILVNFLFRIGFRKFTEMLIVMKASSKKVTNVRCGHLHFVCWKEDLLCWQYVYLDYADFRKVICGVCPFKCVCDCSGSNICSKHNSVSSRKTNFKHFGEMTNYYVIAIISILNVSIMAGNCDYMFVQRV